MFQIRVGGGRSVKSKSNSSVKSAFTLIELLVVIAIIALLLAILIPALGTAKRYAQRLICSNNVKQQCLGIRLYSEQNDGFVPVQPKEYPDPSNWPWDMSFWVSNQICQYAGIDNKVFFCPGNTYKKSTDARFWQYSWVTTRPGDFGITLPYSREVAIKDESNLTPATLKEYFRVMPYVYLLEKLDSSGNSKYATTLLNGEKPKWITKMTHVNNSSAAPLAVDSVVSQNTSSTYNFDQITAGGVDDYFPPILDASNHLSKHTEKPGVSNKIPEGANTGYVDGHVTWSNFGSRVDTSSFRARTQIRSSPVFWW